MPHADQQPITADYGDALQGWLSWAPWPTVGVPLVRRPATAPVLKRELPSVHAWRRRLIVSNLVPALGQNQGTPSVADYPPAA
jgi:hypothetical protein